MAPSTLVFDALALNTLVLDILMSDDEGLIIAADELVFLALETLELDHLVLDTLVLSIIVLGILMLDTLVSDVLVLDVFALNIFVLDGCELLIAVDKLAFIELENLVLDVLLLDALVLDARELLEAVDVLVFLELDALMLNSLVLVAVNELDALVLGGSELPPVVEELVLLELVDCEFLVALNELDTLELDVLALNDLFPDILDLDDCGLLIAVDVLSFLELGPLVLVAADTLLVSDSCEVLAAVGELDALALDVFLLNILLLGLLMAADVLAFLELGASVFVAVDKLLARDGCELLVEIDELDALVLDVFLPDNCGLPTAVDVFAFPEVNTLVLVVSSELSVLDGCELLTVVDELDILVFVILLLDALVLDILVLDGSKLLVAVDELDFLELDVWELLEEVDKLEALLLDNAVCDGFGLLVAIDELVFLELNNCELLAAVVEFAFPKLDTLVLAEVEELFVRDTFGVLLVVDEPNDLVLDALVLGSCELVLVELGWREFGKGTAELRCCELCDNDELEDILLDDRGLFVGMEKLLSSVDRRELLELTGIGELSVCWLREDTEERGLCELVGDIEEPEVMRLDDFKLSTGTDTLLVAIFELAFLELIGIDVLAGIDELESFLLEIDTQELGVCELEGVIIDNCELLEGIGDLLVGTDELASLGLAETNVLGFCELERDAEECTLVELFDRVDEPELGFIVVDNHGMLWLIDELALPELGFRELERGVEELNDCELFDATDELVGVTLDTCELIVGTKELAL